MGAVAIQPAKIGDQVRKKLRIQAHCQQFAEMERSEMTNPLLLFAIPPLVRQPSISGQSQPKAFPAKTSGRPEG